MGMDDLPLAADLMKDVGYPKRPLHRLAVLGLPGEVLNATRYAKLTISDHIELNEFALGINEICERVIEVAAGFIGERPGCLRLYSDRDARRRR